MQRQRLVSAIATFACSVLIIAGYPAPVNAAMTYYCVNADNRPPWNWNDRCAVSPVDRGTNFIAEFAVPEVECLQPEPKMNKMRVRVVGDYVASGDKFLIRSIGIRYLSGYFPVAYYKVHVYDGNGHYYTGYAWNNYNNIIYFDGAIRGTDNTVNLTPNHGFAPPFGLSNKIQIHVYPYLYRDTQNPALPEPPNCWADYVVTEFWGP
ncbi:MAG TPA: hypothetical protein VFH03_09240 [Actinoplanes sp.]|nr:hypothetical protein [Actinoplanes sp.]